VITIPESDEAITKALKILTQGGVIAHATETCYGLACDLTNQSAVEKLFAMKKRGPEAPASGLFLSIEDAGEYIEWDDRAKKLAEEYLPGALTLILPIRKEKTHVIFPTPLSENKTLGVRISSHNLTHTLREKFGKPLSTTSANVHGKPSPYSAQEICEQFEGEQFQPDIVIDSGIIPQNNSSTVVDATGPELKVLRQGELRIS